MNFLIHHDLLNFPKKLELYIFSRNHPYLLENIMLQLDMNLSELNTFLGNIFFWKHNKSAPNYIEYDHAIRYNINKNTITAIDLVYKYLEEYEILANFLDLITSTFIEEEQIIEHSFFKNWLLYPRFPLNNILFLYINCYKYPGIISEDYYLKQSDYKAINFYNNDEILDLCVFESVLMYSDLIIDKIRNEYDIDYFDWNFVKKYYSRFKQIYYLGEDLDSDDTDDTDDISNTESCIILSKFIKDRTLYQNVNLEDCTFKYFSSNDYIVDKHEGLILYNIINDNNFNIVYLYDYYGNLEVLQKFNRSVILTNPTLYEFVENRTDIILYINDSHSFKSVGFGVQLEYDLFRYLLKLHLNTI